MGIGRGSQECRVRSCGVRVATARTVLQYQQCCLHVRKVACASADVQSKGSSQKPRSWHVISAAEYSLPPSALWRRRDSDAMYVS